MIPPILYEDNHLLVVIKPPGMLSQEDRSGDPDVLTIFKEYLRVRDHKPGDAWLGLVHRLDRPTGGVMVLAKTSKAAGRLSRMFRERTVDKRYLLLLHGRLGPEGETLDLTQRLMKDRAKNRSVIVPLDDDRQGSRIARTVFTPWAYDAARDVTLAEAAILTGRSHQIRVQAAGAGHPLVGDRKYGDPSLDRRAGIEDPEGPDTTLYLWAWSLRFTHPVRKDPRCYQARPEGGLWEIFPKTLRAPSPEDKGDA